MKQEKQRKRMSEKNPMKNPEIAMRVGVTKKDQSILIIFIIKEILMQPKN